MTAKKDQEKEKTRGEIFRSIMSYETSGIFISPKGRLLLYDLKETGRPATSCTDYPEIEQALRPRSLYRETVLVSWWSMPRIGERLGYGQAKAGRPEQTPKQIEKVRSEAVRRSLAELVRLNLVTVLKGAAPSYRPDLRTNLYIIDLEHWQTRTTPLYGGVVMPNDPSTERGRYDERPLYLEENDPSVRRGKEESKDESFSLSETSESVSREEREIISALVAAGYVSKTNQRASSAAQELLSLEATPEQVATSRQVWRDMGRTFALGLDGLVKQWPAIAAEQRLKVETSAPAVNTRPPAGQCHCGGNFWLSSPTGRVQCWKTHDESGQPDRDRWLELELSVD